MSYVEPFRVPPARRLLVSLAMLGVNFGNTRCSSSRRRRSQSSNPSARAVTRACKINTLLMMVLRIVIVKSVLDGIDHNIEILNSSHVAVGVVWD